MRMGTGRLSRQAARSPPATHPEAVLAPIRMDPRRAEGAGGEARVMDAAAKVRGRAIGFADELTGKDRQPW